MLSRIVSYWHRRGCLVVCADVHQVDLDSSAHPALLWFESMGSAMVGTPPALNSPLLQALHESGVLVPKPLALDISRTISEHDCLVIEHIAGDSGFPVTLR